MTNMTPADFLNAVDHAAGMNDRWLFLAAFCLLLLVCGVVIHWLVRQLQGLIADHKALRDEHHAALTQIIDKQNETSLKLRKRSGCCKAGKAILRLLKRSFAPTNA